MESVETITIRPATVRDLYVLADFIPAFHEEFGGVYRYDPDRFLMAWLDWLRLPSHALFVAVDGDRVIGSIGGEVEAHPYTPGALMGREYFWYIEPASRKSGAGKQLLDAFTAWVKECGATHMTMVFMHNGQQYGLLDFYKREGFVAFETQVIRSL